MQFISTRGGEKVTGAQAIVQGLAKNGGLFVPETFPKIIEAEFEEMKEMSYVSLVNVLISMVYDEDATNGVSEATPEDIRRYFG